MSKKLPKDSSHFSLIKGPKKANIFFGPSSKRTAFEFTSSFRYTIFGSLVLIWKLETITGKSCT